MDIRVLVLDIRVWFWKFGYRSGNSSTLLEISAFFLEIKKYQPRGRG